MVRGCGGPWRASTAPDVFGSVSGSNNLIGDGTGLTGISNGDANNNQVGVNPLLDPNGLQNHGGPFQDGGGAIKVTFGKYVRYRPTSRVSNA